MKEEALVPRGVVAGLSRSEAASRTLRYWAFLSYSHKDSATADWLHGALERYRVPRTLVGRETTAGTIPAHFNPIFRDRHELAASGDLGQTIRQALAASRCLIVLCSPHAAQSRWTNEEIIAFKRAHPKGCVLAAIVAGEPFASEIRGREAEECFPPALRQKYDRKGRPTAKRAEPIAADLRDSGDGRQLGMLKIVAGMLGVGLDDLVQREQQRRNKRLTYVAAASLAGMTVTSGLAVFAFDKRDEARDQRRDAEGLVGFMLGDLRAKLEPIGRLDALDAVGSRALSYFEKQDQSELSDDALAQRSKALTLIGEIANTRGDLDAALARYREASASTGEFVRRYPDDPQRLFDHAQNVFWVGYIAYQRGQLSDAARLFGEYKRLASRMVSLDPAKNDYRREIVYANTNLGAVLIDQRRYREAVPMYQESVRVAEALAAAEPGNSSYQRQVSNNLAWLADAHEYSGALEEALADRERQMRFLRNVERAEPGDMKIQREIMTAHRSLGRLLASRGDVPGGIRESLAGMAIADRLYRVEPENTEWLQANASGRFDLADLQLASGNAGEAAITTRAACDIVDRLVRLDSSVADWKSRFRVNCLSLRARLALAGGDPAGGLALAQQARTAANASAKPIDRAVLGVMAASSGSAALVALGRREEARRWATDALGAIPANIGLKPREMVELGSLMLHSGDSSGARELVSRLRALGYRHPTFVRSGLARAVT